MSVVFYVVGGLTAVWAVILAGIGITRPSFPAGRGATRGVMVVSALLVAGAVGTGILAATTEEEEADATEVAEEGPDPEAAPETADEEEAREAEAEPPETPEEVAGDEVELSAEPSGELAFDTDTLRAEAGRLTLVMDNPSPIPHNVSLEGDGLDREGETVPQGEVSTVGAELERGEYTFYCSVPGHREGGMEGTLTVE